MKKMLGVAIVCLSIVGFTAVEAEARCNRPLATAVKKAFGRVRTVTKKIVPGHCSTGGCANGTCNVGCR